MKRWIHASLILFLLISVVLFDTTVFANSSWQWISETRPFDLLPIVAVATIFIETAAINWGGNVHRLYKVFGMNILANMVSFLVPYLLNWADQVTHMKYPVFSDMIQNFDYDIPKWKEDCGMRKLLECQREACYKAVAALNAVVE